MFFNQQTGDKVKLLSEDQRGKATFEHEDGEIETLSSNQFHALYSDSLPPEVAVPRPRRLGRSSEHKEVAATAAK